MRGIALLSAFSAILFAQGPARDLYTEAVINGSLPGLHSNHLYFIDRPNRVRLFSPDGHFLDIVRRNGSDRQAGLRREHCD